MTTCIGLTTAMEAVAIGVMVSIGVDFLVGFLGVREMVRSTREAAARDERTVSSLRNALTKDRAMFGGERPRD